jgi:DNA invertase Pin-like site-specific DNA recombinase
MFRRTANPKATVALCYIRQSYTRDSSDMTSPERQRMNIQKILDQHAWTAEWYEDVDGHKSGRDVHNRPGWLALSERLDDGDVAVLIANDLSRLHRKGWRVGDLIEHLEKHDVDLIMAEPGREVDTSTPMGKMFVYFTAMFDEYYASDISHRIQSSIRHRRALGITVGSTPFGTERDADGYLQPRSDGVWLMPDGSWEYGKSMSHKPDPAAIWRGYYAAAHNVLTIYATNKRGLVRLARQMNDDGWAFRSADGVPRPFNGQDIRRIVAAWQLYGGVVDPIRAKDRPGYKDVAGKDAPLIEERSVFPLDLLRRVGDVRRERGIQPRNHGTKPNTYHYALSHILYCAHCEHDAREHNDRAKRSKMTGMISNGVHRYRHAPKVRCASTVRTIRIELVENELRKIIDALQVEPGIYRVMMQHAIRIDSEQRSERTKAAEERQMQLSLCHRRLDAAKHLYLEGEIDRNEFVTRREELQRDLTYWENYDVEIEEVEIKLQTCVEALKSLVGLWDRAHPEEKQQMVRNLFEYVVYNLETQCIVDFRLQPWADEFLVLRAALYERDPNSPAGSAEEHATPSTQMLRDMPPRGLENTTRFTLNEAVQLVLYRLYRDREFLAQNAPEVKPAP